MKEGTSHEEKEKCRLLCEKFCFYGVLILLAFVCVIPLYWMVRSSFMKIQIFTVCGLLFSGRRKCYGAIIRMQ